MCHELQKNQKKKIYGSMIKSVEPINTQSLRLRALRVKNSSATASTKTGTFKKLFAVLIMLSISLSTTSYAVDMTAIAQIESSNGQNPKAYDVTRLCIGKYQINHKTALVEYNQFNRTNYTKFDLLDDDINLLIADWYMHKRIPQMLRHFKKVVSTENQIIAYNAGVKYVVDGSPLPNETKTYLKKYKELTK